MQITMLFPGQGAQYVGMARSLIEKYPLVDKFYKAASERIGVELKTLSVEGPAEELVKTSNTQPAIYMHSVALSMLLKERGITPHAVAGHSLGEYSALAAAGWLDPLDGLELVHRRGELMYQAGLDQPGTMAAVIGAKPDLVEECCAQASKEAGVVQAANFNCPGQIAISGSLAGVDRAIELLKENRVRLIKKLDVSGAFHSPLMESARQGLLEKLASTSFQQGSAPVYCNVTGARCDDVVQLRELLGRQLTETVRWEPSMEAMLHDGLAPFLELGPGNVLGGLLKRIDKEADCTSLDSAEQLEQWLENA